MFLRKQLGAALKDKRLTVGESRPWGYQLPPLAECRKLFAEQVGQDLDWDGEDWEQEEWQHDINYQQDWEELREAMKKARP